MSRKFSLLEILTIITTITTIITIFTTIYYSNLATQFQESSKRADLNAIINVLNYTQINNRITISLSGNIQNEGTRQTEIMNITIGLRYLGGTGFIGENGFIDLVTAYGGNSGSLLPGWSNSVFKDKESKNVNLLLSYDYPSTLSLPIKAYIIIKHFDGAGFQEQEFPLLINKIK